MGNCWAYICLTLNVLLPGTGTILCACLGDVDINKTQFSVGILQLLTSVYLIGWGASLYWGYLIVVRSRGDHNELRTLVAGSQTPSGEVSGGNARKRVMNPHEDA